MFNSVSINIKTRKKMQMIKRKELFTILNENKDLLGTAKEIMLFHIRQLPRFSLDTNKAIIYKKGSALPTYP